MTPRQREVLLVRLAKTIAWYQFPASYRDDATRIARRVVDELEELSLDAGAQRRAVDGIERSLRVVGE